MGFKPDKDIIYKFLTPSLSSILFTVILVVLASFIHSNPLVNIRLPGFIGNYLLGPLYSNCIGCMPRVPSLAMSLLSSYILANTLEFINIRYEIVNSKEIKKSFISLQDHKRILVQSSTAIFLGTLVGFIGFPLSYYEPAMAACTGLNCPEPEPAKINWFFLTLNILFWHIFIGLIYVKGLKHTE